MFKWVDQLRNKGNHKKNGSSIQSLIQMAVKDAEEITSSIKTKAQEEAENEASITVEKARQDAEEIKASAEAAARKEAEDIVAAAKSRAETAEAEVREKIRSLISKAIEELKGEVGEDDKQIHSRLLSSLQELLDAAQNEEVKQPSQLEEEVVNDKVEELLQAEEEATLAEPVESTSEEETTLAEPVGAISDEETTLDELVGVTSEELPDQSLPEKGEVEEAPGNTPLKLEDTEALYSGDVELVIPAPVNLNILSKFYDYLQTIPDVKILYTRGSWDSGTTITIALDSAIPLISFILKMPGVEVIPELSQDDNLVKERPSALLRARKSGVKRFKLSMKEK